MKRIRADLEEHATFLHVQRAEEAKASGNEFFKRGQWQKAVTAYSRAIRLRGESGAGLKVFRGNSWLTRLGKRQSD